MYWCNYFLFSQHKTYKVFRELTRERKRERQREFDSERNKEGMPEREKNKREKRFFEIFRNFGDDYHYSKYGLRFICVCPSFVLTNIIQKSNFSLDDQELCPLMEELVIDAKAKNKCLLPEVLAAD